MEDLILIKAWFSTGKDYQIGYEIYRRLGTNSLLKSLLKTEDDWNISELEEQLYGLLSQLQKAGTKQVVEPNREKVEEILSNEVKVPSDRTTAPLEIKEAVKRRKYLYASSRDSHSQLKALDSFLDAVSIEKKRLNCKIIIENFQEISSNWDLTNYYDLHLKLPINTKEGEIYFETMDTASLNISWMIDYKYIQKYKAKAGKAAIVNQRILDCMARQKILIKRDAFIYERHTLPTITGS